MPDLLPIHQSRQLQQQQRILPKLKTWHQVAEVLEVQVHKQPLVNWPIGGGQANGKFLTHISFYWSIFLGIASPSEPHRHCKGKSTPINIHILINLDLSLFMLNAEAPMVSPYLDTCCTIFVQKAIPKSGVQRALKCKRAFLKNQIKQCLFLLFRRFSENHKKVFPCGQFAWRGFWSRVLIILFRLP